jgi:hypothetical protein
MKTNMNPKLFGGLLAVLVLLGASSHAIGKGDSLGSLVASGKVKVESAGTGETIGHIADLKIQNLTDQPLTCAISPMILESSSGQNQHYACPSGQNVALNPQQTKTVPINGVCLNRNKPPVGKGVSGDLVMNEANPAIPQNSNAHLVATDANRLLRICASKYEAAEQLQKSGALKNLPYHDPQKQKDIAVQWSTWTDPVICQMTGSPPATKEDLRKVVYKQVTGPMTTAKKKKVDEGIDAIFSAVELTSAKAKDLEKTPSAEVALTGEAGKGPTIEETPPSQATPQPEGPTADHSVNPEIARQFDDSVNIKGCKAVSCGTASKIQGVKGNTIVTCPGNKTCGPAPCACFVYEAPKNDPSARWKKSPITLAGEVDFDPAMDYACFCTN